MRRNICVMIFSMILVALLARTAATWRLASQAGGAQENAGKDREDAKAEVWRVLDELHAAASMAEGQRYFSLFSNGAVFIGTDESERWTIEEFNAYAMKRFETGKGWTYALAKDAKSGAWQRHIDISADRNVAWFDELLDNAKYGTCRGTGVLVMEDEGWRIAQYHLTIPVPNELAEEVVQRIRARASEKHD